MVTDDAADVSPEDDDFIPVDELIRQQGTKPVQNVHDMADLEVFESDEEMYAFIEYTYARRRANLA